MELLITRNQKSGFIGGVKFQLTAKAKLTDEETSAVYKYKMGDTVLYEKPNNGPSSNSLTSALVYRFTVPRVSVNDLVSGKTIETKDILEILDAEEQLMVAARNFHRILNAAATFGGEVVHQFTKE